MASYAPTKFLTALNQGKVVVGTDSFKIALFTGTVPIANRNTQQQYSDISANEASGTNYTAGGQAITLTAADYTTGGVFQSAVTCSASPSWTTVTLTSVTYAAIYDTTPATKYLCGIYDFGGAQSVTANTFTINFTDTTPSNRCWYLSTT